MNARRGAAASPLAGTFDWGHVTQRRNTMYLHVTDPSRETLTLTGVNGRPRMAVDLATGDPLELLPSGQLSLPPMADALPRTIGIKLDARPQYSTNPQQVVGEPLRLDVWLAERSADETIRWDFTLAEPGDFRVVLLSKETSNHFHPAWHGEGLRGRLATAGAVQMFSLTDDGRESCPILHYWQIVRSEIGVLRADTAATYWLEIRDLPVCDSKWHEDAVNLVAVRLEPLPTAR